MRKIPRVAVAGAMLAASAVVSVAPIPGATIAGAVAPSCGTAGTPDVTSLQSPNFYIDQDRDQLFAQFAGYVVESNGAPRDGLWLELSGFTGGVVSLGSTEAAAQPIDALDASGPGASQARFFLLKASGVTATAQTHTISVLDGSPARGGAAICTTTFTYNQVVDTIAANANKVTSVSSDTTTEVILGDEVTVTVNGNTGTLGAGPAFDPGALNYTPTALASFPSGAWRLEHTELTISPNGTAAQQTYYDQLRLPVSASGPNRPYTARYTFRAVGPVATSTPVVPIQYIASGTQIKHTTLSGLYPSLPPVSSTFNVTIDKTVDRPTIEVGDSTEVEYTVVISNDEARDVRLDYIVDTLPLGATYLTGTLDVDGTPSTPTDTDPLTIRGPITVPAGGSVTVVYGVDLGTTTGSRVNSAIAEYGNVEIDASADLLESTPASATVLVEEPVPAVAVTKSAGEVTDVEGGVDGRADAGDTITYTYVVANIGTADLSDITVVDDKIADGDIVCDGATDPTNVIASITRLGADVTCTADYTITQADIDAGEVTNTVTVTANGPSEEVVTHEESVTKALPAVHSIEVDKSGVLDITVVTPDDRADAGDTASYTYLVTNSGNITELDVVLTDNKIADADLFCGTTGSDTTDDNVIDALAPGETRTCTGEYALLQDDLDAGSVSNIALATSTDTEGEGLETIELVADPALSISKVADRSTVELVGDIITYTITVENTGNVTMSGVEVSDELLLDLACTADAGVEGENGTYVVAPGETVTCTGTYEITESDLVDLDAIPNVALVIGYAPGEETAREYTDSESVDIDPLLTDLAGRVWVDRDASGTYNTGDIPLIGWTVTAELIEPRQGGAITPASLPEQVLTAVTGPTGAYRMSDLRAGTYRVSVTQDPLIVFQTGDSDGGTDWVVVVDAPPALAPAGSVGSQANGGTAIANFRAQGPGTIVGIVFDPTTGNPYPNSTVTCRWAGPDNVFGNADDWTMRTVANSLGGYRLAKVPFGEYYCVGLTSGNQESLPATPGVVDINPVNAPLPLPTIPETGLDVRLSLALATLLMVAGVLLLQVRRRAFLPVRR